MWKLLRGRAGPRSRAAALDSNTDHSPPKQPPPTIHNREHGSGRCAVARRGQLTAARRRAAEKRRARCTASQRRVRARVQRAASLASARPWQSRHTWGLSRRCSVRRAPLPSCPPFASALARAGSERRARSRQAAGLACSVAAGSNRGRSISSCVLAHVLSEGNRTPPKLPPWPPFLQLGAAVGGATHAASWHL